MRNWKKLVALLIAVAMLLCLCACGEDGPGEANLGEGSGNAERDAKILAEPKEISFIVPGYDGTDENSAYYKAIKELETKYGKKVTVMQAVGDQTWNQKVAAQVAVKDPIDVFYVSISEYLNMYQKGYMKAVDEYIDLTQPWHQLSVMDDYVKFDGKYYAGHVTATAYVMYYNRDLLINNGYGADEPMDLYEAGEWTWEKFVEICRECYDEEAKVVGIENMFDEVFQASNACRAVDFVDGQYKLNIKSAEMRKTLEMVQDIFYTNKICGVGYVTGQNKFLKGRAVFHGAYAYEEKAFAALKKEGTISLDFGVAPFPVGPNNTENKNFGHSTGFAIAKATDAPYTSGMLIDLIGKYQHEEETAKDDLLQEGSKELYDTLAKNLYIPSYTDGVLEQGFGAFYLLYYIRQGDDINKVIGEYETIYQKMIDDANKLL